MWIFFMSKSKYLFQNQKLYSFFRSNGPTLSPVALLCFTWLPSHKGKVPDLQHLYIQTPTTQISECLIILSIHDNKQNGDYIINASLGTKLGLEMLN